MLFFKNLFSKTHSTTLTVTSSSGFHLRPVAQFVAEAKSFTCIIQASFQGKRVNAKAVNTLLSLNLEKTNSFILTAKGPSSKEALDQLTYTFQRLMHEDKEVTPIEKKLHNYEGNVLEGDIIAEGITIAPLHHYVQNETYAASNVNFQEAIRLSLAELETLYKVHQSNENAAIYLAQKELLSALALETNSLKSLETLIAKESDTLKHGKLEAKIADYQDLLKRVKHHLGYNYEVSFPKKPFILVANDLLPSDIVALEKSAVEGVILKKTSPTSHTAILLRSSGIPSLILDETIEQHQESVILDAQAGVLVTTPSLADHKKAKEQQVLQEHQLARSHSKRFHQALTKTEKRIYVLANVSDVASAHVAKENGAEGIGLLRTEFLFDTVKPSLKDQQDAYENIFALFTDITVRTLDIGGDKALPYIDLPEEKNPFLGIRGVRLFKTHPQILEEQLYAIFVASQHKTVKIMFPMISNVTEFNEAKIFAQEIAKKHQLDISNILFGIMVEVPSVIFLLADFNKVVDFYSIGTNDLTQYLYAIERTHPSLHVDPLSPAVFTAIDMIVKHATKPVSICGELASDKHAIAQLIDSGLQTLSINPKSIAQTKETIRHV